MVDVAGAVKTAIDTAKDVVSSVTAFREAAVKTPYGDLPRPSEIVPSMGVVGVIPTIPELAKSKRKNNGEGYCKSLELYRDKYGHGK